MFFLKSSEEMGLISPWPISFRDKNNDDMEGQFYIMKLKRFLYFIFIVGFVFRMIWKLLEVTLKLKIGYVGSNEKYVIDKKNCNIIILLV